MTTRASVSLPRPDRIGTAELGVLAILAVAIGTGIALSWKPMLAVVPLGLLIAALLLLDGRARTVFVLVGGTLVFQQSETLDTSKMGFLMLFAVAFVGAAVNVRAIWDRIPTEIVRPLIGASVAMGVLALLSFFVAYANEVPLVTAWLRDIAPHLLFVAAPIFALDAQQSFSRKGLITLLVSVGVLGATAFAVQWLDRRGIAHLYASRIGLASHFPPAAVFAFGMSAALQAGRTRWLALSGLVLSLLLVTGTRATLTLLAAPLAIAVGVRAYRTRRFSRLIVIGPLALALTVALMLAVLELAGANQQFFDERVAIFKSSGTASDHSYIERLRQSEVAWETFKASPVFGSGPGTNFEWITIDGQQMGGFLIDTPLSYLAKFGLIGCVVLLIIMQRYWRFARLVVSRRQPTVAQLAIVGFLAVVAASMIFASPFENKGLSFGLIALLAVVLKEQIALSQSQLEPPRLSPPADGRVPRSRIFVRP